MQSISTQKNQKLDTTNSEALRTSKFGKLFEADRNRLYTYIYAFVSNRSAADDIFQETCLVLWREFDKFEIGTEFSKWANVIAFNRVRHYRQAQKKYQLGLSDDFIEELSQNILIVENDKVTLEQKWRYLEHCRSLLSEPLKKTYQSFYVENLSAKDLVESTGRSIHAIRKSVFKLRKRLFDCVEQKVREGSS